MVGAVLNSTAAFDGASFPIKLEAPCFLKWFALRAKMYLLRCYFRSFYPLVFFSRDPTFFFVFVLLLLFI